MTPLLYTKSAQLPTEVQNWLDSQAPLPTEVQFYPAQTKPIASVIPWFALALLFVAMGSAAPATLLNQYIRNGFTPRTGYFLFGSLFLALFLVVLLYGILAGAVQDLKLTLAKRNGRLRHGLFITPQDILIRLPHELHYLPRYSFTQAEEITIQRGSRQIKAIQFEWADHLATNDDGNKIEEPPLVIRPKLVTPNHTIIKQINSTPH